MNRLRRDESSDEEVVIITKKNPHKQRRQSKQPSRGSFNELMKGSNGPRKPASEENGGRNRTNTGSRIEASMKKAFSDTHKQKALGFDRGSTRPNNLARMTSISPSRNPIRPSRPVQSPSFDMKLEAIERKLNILAVENEKVTLGQAVIGRQLELVVSFLSGNSGSSGGKSDSVNIGDARAHSRSNSQEGGCTPSSRSDTPTFDSAHVDGDSPGRNGGEVRQIDGTSGQGRGSVANNDSSCSGVENPGDSGGPEGFRNEELKVSAAEKLFGVHFPPPTTPSNHEGIFDGGETFDQHLLPEFQQPEYSDDEDSEEEGKFKAINQFRLVDKDGSGTLDLDEILAGAKILGIDAKNAIDLFNIIEKSPEGEVKMDDFIAAYQQWNPDNEKHGGNSVIVNENGEWMISPRSSFRLGWDLCLMMPFLLYLTIVLPFRLTFVNEAPLFTWVYWFEFMIDLLFVVDMGLNFRTGLAVETKNAKGENYEAIEFDKHIIAMTYIKSWFFIDFFSGVPFSLIDLISNGGAPNNAKSLKALRFLKLARLLKLGRLLKIEKILYSLDRDALDRIEDFFTDGASLSINSLLSLLLALAFVVHLMACCFVLVGRMGDEEGDESWLHYEMRGPFYSKDTTGVNGDNPVYSIYIASFYFCLTTMTSVGYGDILPRNNSERLFVIFLEFASSIVFATVIGLITAVVTSLDMGAKKKAEGLAEVSSFIAFRRFPQKLSRRIRRHFRNFYSLKTAMDEKKIFSEMSTALRKDVSEFLVFDLMGSDSFFTTVSTTLWPRLLPLLQPMTIEANERLCKQGEECEEMYVVITGSMTGFSHSGDVDAEKEPTVKRRMTKGDSINVLCLLEIWYKCVETVDSGPATAETYAVKSEEFVALFQSDMDVKNFTTMQKREVKKFQFVPNDDAPTNLGMPMYMCCFSTVEIKISTVVGSVLHSEHVADSRTVAWAVIDLMDDKTEKPCNTFWSYETAPSRPQVNADGTLELDCGEEMRWSDVSLSFKNLSLRVRIFVADFAGGTEYMNATTSIPLPELQKNMPKYGTGSSDFTRAPGVSSHREHWVNENPLVTGDVVAWCELGTARTSRQKPNPDSGWQKSNSESFADDQEVYFGEVWSRSNSSPGLKLRARIKRPGKKKKSKSARNDSVLSGGSFASEAIPKSLMPMPNSESDSFLGTKAAGRSVANKGAMKRSNSTSAVPGADNTGDY